MSNTIEPSLSDLIEEAVLRALMEGRTAIPGHVVGYRPFKAGVAEHLYVELGIKRQTVDGRVIALPKVDRVPILWPGASDFTSGSQMENGDEVLCIVCDRAIDAWIDGGGVQVPRSGRLQDITDIVALPGLTSAGRAVTVQRGSKTYYIGTKDGRPPWIRIENRDVPTIKLEATEVRLGENATRGVARMNDSTAVSQAALDPWFVWFTAVGVATGATPPFGSPIASISTASAKAKAE